MRKKSQIVSEGISVKFRWFMGREREPRLVHRGVFDPDLIFFLVSGAAAAGGGVR